MWIGIQWMLTRSGAACASSTPTATSRRTSRATSARLVEGRSTATGRCCGISRRAGLFIFPFHFPPPLLSLACRAAIAERGAVREVPKFMKSVRPALTRRRLDDYCVDDDSTASWEGDTCSDYTASWWSDDYICGTGDWLGNGDQDDDDFAPVSYTHLTLPTICSV